MHRKTNDGVGVYLSILMWDRIVGICPFRAPTKHILDDVIMCTERPPNADIATKTGIIHWPKESTSLPNVWKGNIWDISEALVHFSQKKILPQR